MSAGTVTRVIRKLRQAVVNRDGSSRTDAQLVAACLGREPGAFEALLQRHGRMVLGVCRRVLGNADDADDAFQATFLVFLSKAASLRRRELLGNWLYGVAYRTALEAKAARCRRRAKEATMRNLPRPHPVADDPWRELQPLLDGELNGLPDKYRVPIVLCDLEGKTRKDAARQLGWPEGTVSGRLARARILLARRLARHGVALSAGALSAALAERTAAAEVPKSLAQTTIKAISAVSAGQLAASAVSVHVAALTRGVLTSMLLNKLKFAAVCLMLFALAGLAGLQVLGMQPQDAGLGQPHLEPAATLVSSQAGQKDDVPKRRPRLYLHAALKIKRAGDDEPQDYRGIIAIDPDTGKWQKITRDGHGPRISPDGETVIFVRHTGGANGIVDSEVWNCDTGGSDNPGKITDIGGLPSWSPDGKHLVVGKGKFDKTWTHKTYRIDANGANAKELPIPETDEVDDWSPDGKWFVTVSDRHPPHGHGYQLYVMQPDGKQERRLTQGGLNCYPRFSPDSRKVVYIRQTAKEGNSVWTVDIEGKNAREVLKEEDLVAPEFACWSPDGKKLAVTRFKWDRDEKGRRVGRPEAEWHLEIMDANGQNRRRVELADATPQWLGHGDWR